ncbi:hypothetical protein WBQ88_06495 [Sphingopyxis sp. CCNWLW253]|uniref:hypothetical protein n=1 Tax=unclassified Sphingopyxis TaxID=2614943 RepID=UPI003012A153
MWWAVAMLLTGSYSDMVKDPAAMRYCAAAAQQSVDEIALANGKDSPEAGFQREIADLFLARLRKLGAADAAALAATRAKLGDTAVDLAQEDRCGQLAIVTPSGGDLVQAAAELDAGMAGGDAAAVAADAADAAVAGEDAETAGYAMQAPGWLEALPDTRRREVRCVTLADQVVEDVGGGLRKDSLGLTAAKADLLAARLTEAIMVENGYAEAGVGAIYNADFEAMSWENQERSAAQRSAAMTQEIGRCRALFDSIDMSGGTARALSPIASPNAAQCYAIVNILADRAELASPEQRRLEAIRARLEKRHYADRGTGEAADMALNDEVMLFNPEAFDALPKAVTDPRRAACFAMAGA